MKSTKQRTLRLHLFLNTNNMKEIKDLEYRKQEIIVDKMFCNNAHELIELDEKLREVKNQIDNILIDKSIN